MEKKIIVEHICEKLLSAKLEKEPWAHKFVKKIFPDNFYLDIISNFPSKDEFKSRVEQDAKAKMDNYNPQRYTFKLENKLIENLNSKQKVFWKDMLIILHDKKITQTVLKIFDDIINLRMKNLSDIEKNKMGTKNFKIFTKAAIVKDFTKYHLGAHTDNYHKLVTFLFYLPKDTSLEKLGTALYKNNVEIPLDEVGSHQSAENTNKNFTKIKTCKFIPNALLIFPRTNYSFHGVDELNIESKERDLLQFNYHLIGEK